MPSDDQTSPKSLAHFGVPLGNILGPVLFNIYVAELPSRIDSNSLQYVDDTTICSTCRSSDILQERCKLEKNIKTILESPVENGLVFKNEKLKYITFSKRKVNDKSYLIRSKRKSIAEKTNVKLLGVNFDQNLTWSSHVNSTVKASYAIPANKLRKSNVILGLYFGNLRKVLSSNVVLRNFNYIRNPNVIKLAQLT